MKKCLLITLMIICFSLLSSCIFFQKELNDVKIIEIKVFDESAVEIEGTIESEHKLDLNSAAPRCDYYTVPAEKGKKYTVEFYFECQTSNELKEVEFINKPFFSYDKEHEIKKTKVEVFEVEDSLFKGVYVIENLSLENRIMAINSWTIKELYQNFKLQASRVHFVGVIFLYDENQEGI